MLLSTWKCWIEIMMCLGGLISQICSELSDVFSIWSKREKRRQNIRLWNRLILSSLAEMSGRSNALLASRVCWHALLLPMSLTQAPLVVSRHAPDKINDKPPPGRNIATPSHHLHNHMPDKIHDKPPPGRNTATLKYVYMINSP